MILSKILCKVIFENADDIKRLLGSILEAPFEALRWFFSA